MPVEVAVDGKRQVVPMSGGKGTIALPGPYSLITIDPDSKVLRQSDAIDRYRDDQASKRAKERPDRPRRRCWRCLSAALEEE